MAKPVTTVERNLKRYSNRLDCGTRKLDALLPAEQIQQHDNSFMRTQNRQHPNLILQRSANYAHPRAGRKPARLRQLDKPVAFSRLDLGAAVDKFYSQLIRDNATPNGRETARFGRNTSTWRASTCVLLAITNVPEIAAVLDWRGALELGGPELLFNIPVGAPISRWIEEGTL
jgi:hypothetical protein